MRLKKEMNSFICTNDLFLNTVAHKFEEMYAQLVLQFVESLK